MEISLESVFKNYITGEEVTSILKNVTLNVKDGEFLAIVGPSGSGKTTLMNIISCLDRPSKGDYLLEGQSTSRLSDRDLAYLRNKHFGFVFQSFNLLPQYTALENVELAMLYSNTPQKCTKERSKEILETLGLKDRLNFKPNQLSGGQKQRVAIARAIVNSPSIVIADEPTGSLDSHTGKEVLEIFKQLNKKGKTVIMVTHDFEISNKANRIVYIKDGMVKEA